MYYQYKLAHYKGNMGHDATSDAPGNNRNIPRSWRHQQLCTSHSKKDLEDRVHARIYLIKNRKHENTTRHIEEGEEKNNCAPHI